MRVMGHVPSQENGWSYTRDRGMHQARKMGGRIHVTGGMYQAKRMGGRIHVIGDMYLARRMGDRIHVIGVYTRPEKLVVVYT